MVGLFYLRINLITILFDKFCKVASDVIFLNCYSGILKRKYIYKKSDNNNFYHLDKFFRIVIKTMVVTLLINLLTYFTIDKFQT